jgi:transcription-repair coupling factor (superfamily II helicase)
MTDELIDRFGEPPKPVTRLIAVALLRGEAAACGITDISQKGPALHFALDGFGLEQVSRLAARLGGRLLFSPGDKPTLTLKLRRGDDPLEQAEEVVAGYRAVLAEDENKI